MSYELAFKPSALKEWHKLGQTVRAQFVKKLAERLENPHVPSAALHGASHVYKIKYKNFSTLILHQKSYNILLIHNQ